MYSEQVEYIHTIPFWAIEEQRALLMPRPGRDTLVGACINHAIVAAQPLDMDDAPNQLDSIPHPLIPTSQPQPRI